MCGQRTLRPGGPGAGTWEQEGPCRAPSIPVSTCHLALSADIYSLCMSPKTYEELPAGVSIYHPLCTNIQ